MVSDSFLPGGTNLLLQLSQWQYFTEGKSHSVTLPLHTLPESCPVSKGSLILDVLGVALGLAG